MEQFLVEYRITDTMLTSANSEDDAKAFVIEEITGTEGYNPEDIEIIQVKKI